MDMLFLDTVADYNQWPAAKRAIESDEALNSLRKSLGFKIFRPESARSECRPARRRMPVLPAVGSHCADRGTTVTPHRHAAKAHVSAAAQLSAAQDDHDESVAGSHDARSLRRLRASAQPTRPLSQVVHLESL